MQPFYSPYFGIDRSDRSRQLISKARFNPPPSYHIYNPPPPKETPAPRRHFRRLGEREYSFFSDDDDLRNYPTWLDYYPVENYGAEAGMGWDENEEEEQDEEGSFGDEEEKEQEDKGEKQEMDRGPGFVALCWLSLCAFVEAMLEGLGNRWFTFYNHPLSFLVCRYLSIMTRYLLILGAVGAYALLLYTAGDGDADQEVLVSRWRPDEDIGGWGVGQWRALVGEDGRWVEEWEGMKMREVEIVVPVAELEATVDTMGVPGATVTETETETLTIVETIAAPETTTTTTTTTTVTETAETIATPEGTTTEPSTVEPLTAPTRRSETLTAEICTVQPFSTETTCSNTPTAASTVTAYIFSQTISTLRSTVGALIPSWMPKPPTGTAMAAVVMGNDVLVTAAVREMTSVVKGRKTDVVVIDGEETGKEEEERDWHYCDTCKQFHCCEHWVEGAGWRGGRYGL
ncbi:MAG: hypothetical protein M1835_004308 [Candelina submexicana]|nr:MAG: hypothetical protein M1835_004308 [Candelina submexicana]